MKEKEIKAKYNIDMYEFANFLRRNQLSYSESYFTGNLTVDDNLIDFYVKNFLKEQQKEEFERAEEKAREDEAKAQEAEEAARKKKAMAEMLITSGFNFDGYTITKYSGYISGDDAISVERGMAIFGNGVNVKDKLMESLVTIRRNALRELKEAAYNLGCNAVIGVDFDYLTLDPQTANFSGGTTYQPYVFGVTANGNAVIIEKNKD
ncbi:MAG: heavy metal-binding domain-containing protein [Oscillospiraceae bacterium]|nr:heavy metal-binding domain-containing protein [Oscillospiraceae bacterium]